MRSFLQNRFIRNTTTLIAGAAVAQIIPLLVSPLIARLYSPHDVGVQAVYISWLSVLAVLATARYEMAIVLPAQEKPAANLLGLSLLCSLTLAILVALGVWGLGHRLTQLLKAEALRPWLWLLPLSVLLAGAMQAWTNWNNRLARYRANANGRIAQSVATAGVQLVGGVWQAGALGLILGQMAGQIASLFAQSYRDIRSRFPWHKELDRKTMCIVLKDYAEFPKVNAPHALSTVLLDAAVLALLTILAGTSAVGFYGLMMRVLKLPVALIGQAVSQVAFRELAVAYQNQQSLRPIMHKMMLMLGLMALVPFLIIYFFGEPLFSLVFGANWSMAGRYAESMSFYILFYFVASPLSTIPLIIKKQRVAFGLSILQAGLFLGSLWLGFVLWQDVSIAFRVLSAVMAAYFIGYFLWLNKVVK